MEILLGFSRISLDFTTGSTIGLSYMFHFPQDFRSIILLSKAPSNEFELEALGLRLRVFISWSQTDPVESRIGAR